MRSVKFIKEHPVGIHLGKEADMPPIHAKRMVDNGYAEYIDRSSASDAPSKADTKRSKTKAKQ